MIQVEKSVQLKNKDTEVIELTGNNPDLDIVLTNKNLYLQSKNRDVDIVILREDIKWVQYNSFLDKKALKKGKDKIIEKASIQIAVIISIIVVFNLLRINTFVVFSTFMMGIITIVAIATNLLLEYQLYESKNKSKYMRKTIEILTNKDRINIDISNFNKENAEKLLKKLSDISKNNNISAIAKSRELEALERLEV